MKLKSKYSFYFVNRLAIFLPIWTVLYILDVAYLGNFIIFYLLLYTILFFIFSKDFIIDNDKIVLFSSKRENYDFVMIEKIVFVEKYWIFLGNQKIKIYFSNGYEKIIKCNGLSSDDEYPYSFYKTYKYTKSVFQNTYHEEYHFLKPKLNSVLLP